MTSIVPDKNSHDEEIEVASQGMHIENDTPRSNDEEADAVVDVDSIPLRDIELAPEDMENGKYSEEDIPIEDGYGDGDPVV